MFFNSNLELSIKKIIVYENNYVVELITRAGALAGVGLALDPEGNKSVLIQPSSLEKKYFKFYIFLIF